MKDNNKLKWPPLKRRPILLRAFDRVRRWLRVRRVAIVVLLAIGGLWYLQHVHSPAFHALSRVVTPLIEEIGLPRNPLWERPRTAPNGNPWPTTSQYIPGYPRLNVFGPAGVVADNSGSTHSLFVKLIDRDQKSLKAVRVGFLRAHDKLNFERVKPGHYDIRYMNLDTGEIRQSPAFEVTATETDGGQQYTGWTVPLYEDVIKGRIYHREITQQEF